MAEINGRIEAIEARITSVGKAADGMPHSVGDPLETLPKLIDAKDKLTERLNHMTIENGLLFLKIMNSVNELKSSTERRVIFLRYIEGVDWEQIADEMGYARRAVFYFHGTALQNLNFEPKD
jgi:DNA-directed RNA polymerase specialized sigma24 family protein